MAADLSLAADPVSFVLAAYSQKSVHENRRELGHIRRIEDLIKKA